MMTVLGKTEKEVFFILIGQKSLVFWCECNPNLGVSGMTANI
jgi:hypothetical protein